MQILNYSGTVNTKLQSKFREYEKNNDKYIKLRDLLLKLKEVNEKNIKIIS